MSLSQAYAHIVYTAFRFSGQHFKYIVISISLFFRIFVTIVYKPPN